MFALLCMHAQGKIRIGWWQAAGASIALLLVISFVRQYRLKGTGALDAIRDVSVFDALAEMGFSLTPMKIVHEWLATGVDQLRFGETYWAPFERTLAIVLPIARPDASDDFRLMNVAMALREGNYGFSISAEAMINFGLIGCFVIGCLVGAFLLFSGRRIAEFHRAVFTTAIAFGVFVHVRQSFVGAFGTAVVAILSAFMLLALAWSIALFRSRRAAAALR